MSTNNNNIPNDTNTAVFMKFSQVLKKIRKSVQI